MVDLSEWPLPANVKAVITTRQGGCSQPPFDSNNLALHVGDEAQAVTDNRRQLCDSLGLTRQPQWLEQVHGTKVVQACDDGLVRTADGCFSVESGLACVVMTADCLPLLMCDRQGKQVAAVHAGWRSLTGGIVRRAVETFAAEPGELSVFLGPAIGPAHFEVGIDVLEAFFDSAKTSAQGEAITRAFRPSLSAPMKYHADLCALMRAELAALGVVDVFGGTRCTVEDDKHFYSYRRDGVTGRMAAMIWLT